jgi:hypothetical protein
MKRLLFWLLIFAPFIGVSQASLKNPNFFKKTALAAIYGHNEIGPLTPDIQFWSDGSVENGSLLDRSGNNRHALVTSNLISNPSSSLGSTFIQHSGTAPSSNTSLNTSPPTGFTGQYYSNIQWTVAAGSGIVRTESFILVSESGYVDFWAKRNTNTAHFIGLQPGNGGALLWQIDLSNASADTYLISGSRAVGNWGHYRRAFTNTNTGGLADLRIQVLTGTHSIDFFISPVYNSSGQDYGGVTISGQSNIAFALPVDATLSTTDTKKNFYSATTGFPLTTRAAYQCNSYVKRIYCGGAFKYIFFDTDPSIIQHDIVHRNYVKPSNGFRFTSIPTRLTVGSGKTYSTPALAFAGARAGTFRDRACIDLYDNLSPSTYAEYTIVSGGGSFQAYIQTNKEYCYLDGSTGPGGRTTITGTKQVSLSDAQLSGTELITFVYNGGVRNVDFVKYNGGYLAHDDAAGNGSRHLSIIGVTFTEFGADAVYDYRTTNALPQPATQLSFNTWAGGFHNSQHVEMYDCTLTGMRAYTWQDAATTNGNGAYHTVDNCTLVSTIIYDVVSNPTSVLMENIRLTSSGGTRNSVVYQSRSTMNSTVVEIGAIKSIFLTQFP